MPQRVASGGPDENRLVLWVPAAFDQGERHALMFDVAAGVMGGSLAAISARRLALVRRSTIPFTTTRGGVGHLFGRAPKRLGGLCRARVAAGHLRTAVHPADANVAPVFTTELHNQLDCRITSSGTITVET